MPWETSTVSDQRLAFVSRYMEDGFTSFAQLCREFGISTATGYRVLQRYDPDNPASLQDRSRRPLRPSCTDAEREAAIVGVRVDHPTWGPKKIRAYLQHDRPEMAWPVTSTIGAVLQRAGLVPSRRYRKRAWGGRPPLTRAAAPNQVWSIDFKGQFATQDGTLCYPLTLMDQSSRFLLRCQAYPGIASRDVQALLQAAFREFGLPACIRSDNGPPFASNAVAGLSALSVWWIRLGIRPETIQPSHPEQNGAHERLHRTLKAEATRPAAASIRAQQRLFDAFRDTYNTLRPHEALGQVPPANTYVRSQRPYPNRLPQIRYPDGLALRTVHRNGCIRWGGGEIFLSEVLLGETVAFEPLPGHRLLVWFAHLPLAVLDDRGPRWLPPSQARPVIEAFRTRATTDDGLIQQ